MPLPFVTESLESLDENVRGLYEEKDGKYQLGVDLGDSFIPASEVAGLKTNHDKLLAEKKQAKAEAEKAAAEAKRIAEENAKKNGDVESLTKSWQAKEQEYQEEISSYRKKEQDFEVSKAAEKVIEGLAEGANAKLLSRFVKERLKYDGGEIKVVDAHGNLTISTLDDLRREFEQDSTFDSLKIGSKATGSGASKGQSGGAGEITITRAQFDGMNQVERAKFFKSGGKVAN